MKLLRHGPAGLERPGLLDAEGRIRDLSAHVHDIAGTTLLPSSLQRLAAIDHSRLPLVEKGIRLGPCVGKVGKVVVVESRSVALLAPSALSGPADAVLLPDELAVHCVTRLGVVIGQCARRVSADQAMAHVAGYCLLTEIQPHDTRHRHLDTFAPLGPWLVTHPLPVAPAKAGSETVAIFVSHVSECMTLLPGDVLSLPAIAEAARPLGVGGTLRNAIPGLGEQHLHAVAPQPHFNIVEAS